MYIYTSINREINKNSSVYINPWCLSISDKLSLVSSLTIIDEEGKPFRHRI